MTDPRFPIGPYEAPATIDAACRARWIDELRSLPAEARASVRGLDDAQLDTPYRDGGWTVRQVLHHVADSHVNSMVRFQLALTEDGPDIRPYFEDRWAELPLYRAPLETSFALLDALHERWVRLLEGMGEADYDRTFRHPERGDVTTLGWNLGMYAWHGKHHVAHVTTLREQRGW